MSLTTWVDVPLWLLLVAMAVLLVAITSLVGELVHIRRVARDHWKLRRQRQKDWEQTVHELGLRRHDLEIREAWVGHREQELGITPRRDTQETAIDTRFEAHRQEAT